MVKHGHAWREIRAYSLSEIGVFLRECILEEHQLTKRNVLTAWLGTNADGDYIKKHILDISTLPLTKDQKKATQDESKKQWMRLAMAMGNIGSVRH